MIHVYTKPVNRMTKQEYSDAWKLNLGPTGLMRPTLFDARSNTSPCQGRAVMAYHNDRLLGWALKWRDNRQGECHLFVYVDPKFRGQGIGRELIAHARMGMREPLTVYPTISAKPIYAPLRKAGRVRYARGY